jgi:hypothetical protein
LAAAGQALLATYEGQVTLPGVLSYRRAASVTRSPCVRPLYCAFLGGPALLVLPFRRSGLGIITTIIIGYSAAATG